jgi:hypothetical protein
MPAASAAALISAPVGWSGASPSGRLLTIVVNPAALMAGTSSGRICGATLTRSLIRFSSKIASLQLNQWAALAGPYIQRTDGGATARVA